MLRFLLMIPLCLAAAGGTAEAGPSDASLFEIGRDACTTSLIRGIPGFDSSPWRRALDEAGQSPAAFCTCVGTWFDAAGDDEMARALREEIAGDGMPEMLHSFLGGSGDACLPATDGLGIDLGLTDEDLDFDLTEDEDSIEAALADNDFPADESDIQACRMAFDDTMSLPGFDPRKEHARVKNSGQSLNKVCTCAASYITALGAGFQAEVENAANPQVIWGSALAGGINICIGS